MMFFSALSIVKLDRDNKRQNELGYMLFRMQ